MTSLVFAAILISILELDRHAGGFMISRPLVVGPLLGWAFGQAELGATVGVLVELISLESIPLGAALTPNATVAVGAVLLLSLGRNPVPLSFAFPAGLFAGWAFREVETWIVQRRAVLAREADRCLERVEEPLYTEYVMAGLAGQFLATGACLVSVVLVARPLLSWAWPFTPDLIQKALTFALAAAPILGLATLAGALRPVRS